jgi:Bax protein
MLLAIGVLALVAIALPVWIATLLAPGKYERMHAPNSVSAIVALFKGAGFDPQAVGRAGFESIPPVFVSQLPNDLKAVNDVDLRKSIFVSVVLPHVLQENERIRRDRERLQRIRRDIAAERELRQRDRRWLDRLAVRYKTKPMDIEDLLKRVDIVPPRLAVAQAAQESGWGTSRFAHQGNALFGQHAPVGDRAIEAKKAAGVALRAFENIYGSVRGYIHNLNTHRAYRAFRDMRASMRESGSIIDGHALADALKRYSEEGTLYVDRLRSIMQQPAVAGVRNVRLSPVN